MLVAYNSQHQLINLAEDVPQKGGLFICPACQSPVRLKRGQIMRPYFAHISLKDCQYFSENESAQHLQLKAKLYRWLKKESRVSVEKVLPEIGQVADLWVGERLALEVQCSSLSISRLQERTRAYRKAGYAVVWLLGKDLWLGKRLSPLQKHLLSFSNNRGFHVWELDDEKDQLRLRYLLHEDWRGQLQGLTQTFPFQQGRFLDLLRLPFGQQKLSSFSGKMDAQLCRYVAQQLYYQQPKWMALQENMYREGRNLLQFSLEDFYPQLRPIQSSQGFTQIEQDLSAYYQAFLDFYSQQKDKSQQRLYPPVFYQSLSKRKDNFQ